MKEIEVRNHPRFYEVFISGPIENPRLYTKNLVPGTKISEERIINYKEIEYREWDPNRSKLAALILEKTSINFLSNKLNCLYLGAASGTTISHLSDIIKEGVIYGVEFAERSIRQLIQNTSSRNNIIPILADARLPESYANSIFSEIDLIYQDVAQPNQAEIAIANSNYYLNQNGMLILAIKSQSIDSISKVEKVYSQERKTLEKAGFEIIESINISKYAANHLILIAKREAS